MAFELSFAEDFFWGDGMDGDYGWQEKSDHPTSVAQALFSMPEEEWNEMVKEVFGCDPEFVDVETVMEKVRDTNTCTDLSPPVEVWIDEEGWYKVQVYESR